MKKLVFSGCSFTAGNGWSDDEPNTSRKIAVRDHPNLYVTLCHGSIPQLQNLDIINCGQGGASNTEIFTNTVDIMSEFQKEIEIVFCQWTAMPRYNFSVGFELWSTNEGVTPDARSKFDVNLSNNTSWNRKYLDDLLDRLLVLHHLHREILMVVRYCNVLQKIAKSFGIKLYFINGLCPWDKDYFVRLDSVLPESYTSFTKKKILDIDSRNDEDIFKLYKQLHNEYDQAGGIDPNQWINLYDSLAANKIDTNYDNLHPGKKSNQLYFNQIKKFLET
jgi:hypothetical protein